MDTREKLEQAVTILAEIKMSGYWPFASPCPCSTEVKIKDHINAAMTHIENALYWHDQMFTRTGRDEKNAPSSTIVSNN